jgi:spore coat protein CotH
MATLRLAAFLLALAALGGPWAAGASADDAAQIFDPSRMYVIKLTLPQVSEEELADHPYDYQPGTFSIAETDGTPSGVGSFSAPVNVGIRLKGGASLRPLSAKSAFKIKFEGSERLRGLRILTLNNMVEDPSMIHETLAYTAFRGAGVPASRTGYAYVYVNGEDFGVHLDIETLDEIALAKIFGAFDEGVQHLYEGEDSADVRPGGAGAFEIDEGSGDRGDLQALIDAVNSGGPGDWATRVAGVADLSEMTRMWATEKYIGQWDGYAGSEAEWLPNNYYLYSDPNGRFQMMPWGNDESWQTRYRLPFDGSAGLLFDSCLADSACAALYRQSVVHVRDAITSMHLDSLAVDTATMLAPWQAMEQAQSTREEHDLGDIEDEVADTREFIAARPGDVAEWLGDEGPGETPPADDRPPAPDAPQPHLQVHLPKRSFSVGRTWVGGGVLHLQVHVRSRGLLVQRVTVQTDKGPVVACRSQKRLKQPRRLTLQCRLADPARAQLRQGHQGISVFIRFTPADGKPQSIVRRVS